MNEVFSIAESISKILENKNIMESSRILLSRVAEIVNSHPQSPQTEIEDLVLNKWYI